MILQYFRHFSNYMKRLLVKKRFFYTTSKKRKFPTIVDENINLNHSKRLI